MCSNRTSEAIEFPPPLFTYRDAAIMPASSISLSVVPPWTLPATLASSGSRTRATTMLFLVVMLVLSSITAHLTHKRQILLGNTSFLLESSVLTEYDMNRVRYLFMFQHCCCLSENRGK